MKIKPFSYKILRAKVSIMIRKKHGVMDKDEKRKILFSGLVCVFLLSIDQIVVFMEFVYNPNLFPLTHYLSLSFCL